MYPFSVAGVKPTRVISAIAAVGFFRYRVLMLMVSASVKLHDR